MKMKKEKNDYSSPQAKVIMVNAQGILCNSNQTEKFGMSSNTYNEDDWE